MASTQPPEGDAPEEIPISFAEFLETVPPTVVKIISDLQALRDGTYALKTPDLRLHCASDSCGGVRTYHSQTGTHQLSEMRNDLFIVYTCRNCEESGKVYALAAVADKSWGASGRARKYGENPLFGQHTSPRLLSLLGKEKETFLKGRRAEFQGLGIGAFAYYRRVVENQKDSLLDEIIKVAQKTDPKGDTIATLQAAKIETQFARAIDLVKDAIPQTLKFNGHNPLTLLHDALSKGLHAKTDEECLGLATTIRRVMQDLAERAGTALKDHAELNAAVNRLMNKKNEKEAT